MPIGNYSAFIDIVRIAIINKPKKVLDCGIGKGILAAAIRNWVDDNQHRTIIHGIEGFANYRNKLWGNYDEVEIINLNRWESDQKYNLIVLSDVIEHLTIKEGIILIEKLKNALVKSGVLIISTPAKFFTQSAVYGNELEIHKSHWDLEKFKGFNVVNDGTPDKWGNEQIVVEYLKY
jgi:2-polyprenyl-3-methyl-5-hydroxy-6-metoxy-1,4-benzoquinol methylase